ncbi:3-hydroxyacyl-CoA dehydrogenase/enoyl-CoA hydratase family protein [bacterium]|nr:3-hydroxyacyl-CoA dehydrogenase/enoyl-CoA hydratase family protein [bacterium]
MGRTIGKVAVLGSGVMGSGIAAHLAGCGYPVLMLDITPSKAGETPAKTPAERNRIAAASVEGMKKARPPKLFSKNDLARIEIGNFEDHISRIAECDWIIEAIVEDLAPKKEILALVDKHRRKDAIVTTNTSGISVEKMVEDCSDDMKRHFLGTHFFNPVRFMKLLEIIPHPKSDPEVVKFAADFCANELGKGVVWCKDTPNFIANRIGMHAICVTMNEMVERGLRIEEVDAIVGEPLGRPRSAAFRTSDLVGLDTMNHVAATVYNNCAGDEEREVFRMPAFVGKLIEQGKLGDKTGSGFYGRKGKEKLVVNPQTLEYEPVQQVELASVASAMEVKKLPDRVKRVVFGDDKAAEFARAVAFRGLIYAANRIPEIADSIVEVDNAMQWGFNWQAGPFRTWDAIGLAESVARMKAEGYNVPAKITEMLAKGNTVFYKTEGGKDFAYDLLEHRYVEIAKDPQVIILKDLPKESVFEKNDGATIRDIGDGIACLEFHTKMNSIDPDIIAMMERCADLLDEGRFEGLVVANDATDFCVGANLFIALVAVNNGEYGQVEEGLKRFQDATMRLKYSPRPVVVAPTGKTLGGGAELCLMADRIAGHAETYMGLIEVGVGLIPAGGGTKEMTLRATENLPGNPVPLLPYAQKAFEAIAMAKVSVGFKEAVDIGLARPSDVFIPSRDLLIHEAKTIAKSLLAAGYQKGQPRTDIVVAGESAKAAFLIAVDGMKRAGWVSDHDVKIAGKVAHIVAGGKRAEGQTISEQELLDMEREAFMSLIGEEKTQARMQHMLMNGKPLRN